LQADRAFAFSESHMDLLGASGTTTGGSGTTPQAEGEATRAEGGAVASLSLDEYVALCPSSYVISHAQTPQLLCKQMSVFNAVAGGDDIA
jgi:hypothetical protein